MKFPVDKMMVCLMTILVCEGEKKRTSEEDRTDEIVIDEVVDDHIKQHILLDRNYNSSFTISVPMLSVVVPGTSKTNGVIKFSISHLTLWSLVSVATLGLVYPILLGPHGKLHKRSFDGRSSQPLTFLDHLESIINVTAISQDMQALIPQETAMECLARSVCEAHQGAATYGLAGLTIRSFFPDSETNIYGLPVDGDTMTAARDAIMGGASCEQKYQRCVVSPLLAYQKAVSYSFQDENDDLNVYQ